MQEATDEDGEQLSWSCRKRAAATTAAALVGRLLCQAPIPAPAPTSAGSGTPVGFAPEFDFESDLLTRVEPFFSHPLLSEIARDGVVAVDRGVGAAARGGQERREAGTARTGPARRHSRGLGSGSPALRLAAFMLSLASADATIAAAGGVAAGTAKEGIGAGGDGGGADDDFRRLRLLSLLVSRLDRALEMVLPIIGEESQEGRSLLLGLVRRTDCCCCCCCEVAADAVESSSSTACLLDCLLEELLAAAATGVL